MNDLRPNRRQVLKRAGALGATAALLSPTAALAKNTSAAQGPEGSWLVNATITSAHPPVKFQALFTYDAGGGFVQTAQNDFSIPTGLRSSAHGAWVKTGEETFAWTFVKFLFDAQGNPAGTLKARAVETLSPDGDAFSGTAHFDVFDVNGKRIASGIATDDAKRIQVEGT